MAGRSVNVGTGSISISPALVGGFGSILQQQLNAVRPQPTVNVGVNVDQRGLQGLDKQVNSTSGGAGRLRTAFEGAFAALSAKKLLDANNQLGGLSIKATLLTAKFTSMAAAGTSLVGVVGGLGAGLAVAGAGVGAFGALAAPQIKAVTTATTAVTTAQDAYNVALKTGDPAAQAAALKQYNAALAGLTPAQRAAVTSTMQLKSAFKAQSDALAPVTLGVYTQGLHLLGGLLPALTPVAKAAGDALSGIFTRMQSGLANALSTNGGLGQFLDVVKVNIGPVLNSLSSTVVNLGHTFSQVFQAFVPLMMPALGMIQNLTGALAKGSSSDGFYNFIAKLRPLIEPLGAAIKSVAGALGAFVNAAVPLAGPVLSAVTAVGNALKQLFNSAQFQAFVTNIGSAITSLTPLLSALVGPIGTVLATISGQFAQLAPMVVPVITQFAQVFSQILVGLSPLLPAFVQLAGVLVGFLPILYPLIAAFRGALYPVITALGQALLQAQPAVIALVQAFISMFPAVSQLLVALVPLIPSLAQALVPAMLAFAAVVNVLLPLLAPLISFFASSPLLVGMALVIWGLVAAYGAYNAMLLANNVGSLRQLVLQALAKVEWAVLTGFVWAGVIAQGAMTAATWALNTAMAVLMSPITLVIVAIAALVFGVIYAYNHFQTFHNIVQAAWQGIQAAASFAWHSVIKPVLDAFAAAGLWLWNSALKPAFAGITWAWNALMTGVKLYWDSYAHPVINAFAAVATWLWSNVLRPVFGAIGAAFGALVSAMRFAWDAILHPVFNAIVTVGRVMATILLAFVIAPIKLAWLLLVNAMKLAWDFVLHPVFNAVVSVARWLWDQGVKPVFGALGWAWNALLTGMRWVWDNVLHPVFNAVVSVARWLWDQGVKPVFGWIGDAWHGLSAGMGWVWDNILHPVFSAVARVIGGVRDAFKSAVDGIGGIWDGLKRIFAAPINAVIFPVVEWLSRGVDAVTQFALGNKPMQPMEHLPRFARGGVIPGNHDRDDVQIYATPGEVVVPKPIVAAAGGADALMSALGFGPRAGGPGSHFLLGGLVHAITHNPLTDAVGSVVGSAGRAVKSAAGAVFNGADWVLQGIAGAIRAGAGDALDGAYHAFAGPLFGLLGQGQVPDMLHRLVDKIEGTVIGGIRGKEQADVGTLGGEAIAYNGGSNTIGLIEGLARGLAAGNQMQVTSTLRHGGGGSYHDRGEAVDFSNGTADTPAMGVFGKAWAAKYGGSLAELIHNGGGVPAIKDGHAVDGPSFYSSVWGNHRNHVHVAISPESIARGRQGLGAQRFGGGAIGGVAGGSIAQQVHAAAAARGWGGQLGALDYIIGHESSWNPNAQNPGSTAHGLFQLLYGGAGSVQQQIAAGFNYIAGRYGNPDNAQRFWASHHWYDQGGWLMPGATAAFNGTGKPEAIFTQDQLQAITSGASGGRSGPLVEMNGTVIREDTDVHKLARQTAWLQKTESATV